jgi:hypothetical protein
MGGKSKSNPLSDVVGSVFKGVSDVTNEATRIAGGGGINLDPFVKQKQEAKDAAKEDDRQRKAALAKQEADAQAQLKVKAANKDAGEGSNIILGGNRKKKKGSSVSSGMGLSKGDTGLQV